jgi:hypothetical protein
MIVFKEQYYTDEIRYDAANGIVEIPMKRREVIERNKKGCLLGWTRPTYHIFGQNWIDAVLTIRQVTAMEMEVDDLLVKECNSRFTVMIGVKIENDRMYLHSLEEVSGKTLCQIVITVKGINIELTDRVQK